MKRIFPLIAFCVLIISTTGCKQGRQPLQYGTDACDYCKMILVDPSFGGEFLTKKGKIYKFDDISCMISYIKDMDTSRQEVTEIFVVDHSKPGSLIPAEPAFFLKSDKVKSPMASGIAAFSTTQDRYEQQQQWQGTELTWGTLKSSFE